MSGRRSLIQLLDNILLWGSRLDQFVGGIARVDFSTDELRQAAASKCIEAIGEACGEILRRYPEFVSANPEL